MWASSVHKLKNIVALLCLLQSGHVLAQLNESDTAKLQVRLQATGMWQRGNVVLDLLRGRAEVVAAFGNDWTFKSQNNSLYQAFNGFKADNDLNSRNYLYFRPQSRVYPFAMAYVQTNFRRKISLRTFAGAGVTWQALRAKTHFVKLSASMVAESSRFNANLFNEAGYDGQNIIVLLRPTAYLQAAWQGWPQGPRLQLQTYWQGGIDAFANNRWLAELSLEQKLGRGFSLTGQWAYQYEQVVARGIRSTDQLFTLGLNYQIFQK